MALQKAFAHPSGFSAPQAYWRLETFAGSKGGVNIRLVAYKSAADYQQGRAALKHEDFIMPFVPAATNNIIQQGYIFIKTQQGWEDAVDA